MISSTNKRNDYIGNNSTATYAYTFRITSSAHLYLVVRSPLNVETPLTLATHYTVTGVDESGGGNIVLVNGAFDWIDGDGFLENGWSLAIRRIVPLKQETDIRNQGDFFPEVHEDVFDYLTFIDQQQQDEIDRSIKLPESIPAADFDPSLPADIIDNPGSAIIVNSTGDGLSLGYTASDIARIFTRTTFAALKALAAGTPTNMRMGWATDIKQYMLYTADLTVGEDGWIPLGG